MKKPTTVFISVRTKLKPKMTNQNCSLSFFYIPGYSYMTICFMFLFFSFFLWWGVYVFYWEGIFFFPAKS